MSGGFGSFEWTNPAPGFSYGWQEDTTVQYNGAASIRAVDINDNQSAAIDSGEFSPDNGPIAFAYKVSSESEYDFCDVRVIDANGSTVQTPVHASGTVDWTTVTFDPSSLPAGGPYRLRFIYSKEVSVSSGSDTAWVVGMTGLPLDKPRLIPSIPTPIGAPAFFAFIQPSAVCSLPTPLQPPAASLYANPHNRLALPSPLGNPAAFAHPQAKAWAALPSPLGAASALLIQYDHIIAYVRSPLGVPSVFTHQQATAWSAIPGPLYPPTLIACQNPHTRIDLSTPLGTPAAFVHPQAKAWSAIPGPLIAPTARIGQAIHSSTASIPVAISHPRLLSDPLPLRHTTDLTSYTEDKIIPWVYGRITLTPIALDNKGTEWLLADHAIQSVTAVTVGNQKTSGYQLINSIDDTGHPISTLRLTQPPKDNAAVTVSITGKRNADTGAVIEHPRDIIRDLLTECGWSPSQDALDNLLDEYPELSLAGVYTTAIPLREAIDQITHSIDAIWSGSPLMVRRRDTITPPVATLKSRDMQMPAASCNATDLATILRVSYAQNAATGQPDAALTLHAPGRIEEIGEITADLTLPWLHTAKDALAIASGVLTHKAQANWEITDTIDATTKPNWHCGDPIAINHPWLPAGNAQIKALDFDPDSARLGITLTMPAGERPAVELRSRSAAIKPDAADPLKITYKNGMATFTIADDTGAPIAGAAVTLDGQTTRQSDRYGAVQFKTTRGEHTLSVTAAGYAPFEITVEV